MTGNSPVSVASAQVIANVSMALRDIIVRGLGDEFGLAARDVSLSAPGEEAPGTTGVALFVYHLRPGKPLGSLPARVRALDGAWPVAPKAEPVLTSLQLELCYMVLPHASDVRSEQRLSTSLAKLFHAFSTIHVSGLPDSDARSELLASGNVRLKLVAQYPEMDVIRRLWSQPGDRKAVRNALYYRVMPVTLPAQSHESLHRVREIVAESCEKAL